MSTDGTPAADAAHADDRTSPPPALSPSRFLVPLGVVVLAVVVLEAGLGEVGFGTGGQQLGLTVAAAVYAGCGYAYLRGRDVRAAPPWLLLAGMAAATVTMYAIDPGGPVVALFLVAAMTPMRPPRQLATGILVIGTLAYNGVQLFIAAGSLLLTLATDAGVVFFFLVGTMLRREREQREELARLMSQLEQSRRAERAAVEVAERARLARELHDVLAHTLSGLALQLEGANLLAGVAPTDPRLVDAVRRAHQLSRSGLAEARRAVGALRGEELPGPAQITDLVAEHRLASTGSVRFAQTGHPASVPPEVGLALYRAAQEALSNVRKHAGNADVEVRLAWRDDSVELTVADTGSGGEPRQDGGGYGLSGMAERIQAVGGTVDAGPATGQGFRVQVRVPAGGPLVPGS